MARQGVRQARAGGIAALETSRPAAEWEEWTGPEQIPHHMALGCRAFVPSFGRGEELLIGMVNCDIGVKYAMYYFTVECLPWRTTTVSSVLEPHFGLSSGAEWNPSPPLRGDTRVCLNPNPNPHRSTPWLAGDAYRPLLIDGAPRRV